MNIDIDKAADAIMSARHSDAFDREACVKILRDNLSGGESRSDSASSGVIGIGTHSESASEKVTNSPPAQFSQPKPESWPEIAREAWKDVTDLADTLEEGICDLQGDTRFIAIVLSAIERSHAAQPHPSKADEGYTPNRCDKHKVGYFNVCPECASEITVKASPLGERSEQRGEFQYCPDCQGSGILGTRVY